jgi:hypothetical protein
MYCHKKNLYCGSPWFKIFGPSELISFWTPLKLRQLSATEIESSMDNTPRLGGIGAGGSAVLVDGTTACTAVGEMHSLPKGQPLGAVL